MDIALLILYIVVLILQVAFLVLGIKKPSKKRWITLYTGEVISIAAASALAAHYNSLPGHGMMPGLTYFAETLYSFYAAIIFGGMLLISVIIGLAVKLKGAR